MSTTETYCKAIDMAITCYMREHRMTQGEMAKKLGMSENTLRWKRNGTSDWKLAELVQLAHTCDISMDDVLAI